MTTSTPIEALREREAFEAWAAGWDLDLAPADSKTYTGLLTQCAWLGWQARAALAAPQAEKAEPAAWLVKDYAPRKPRLFNTLEEARALIHSECGINYPVPLYAGEPKP